MNKLVKCDSCGLTLNVPQKNNDLVRIIRCPNCSHQLRVEFGSQPEDSGKTVYGGGKTTNRQSRASEDGATVYAQKKNISKGMLRCDGKLYPLHIGKNVVGRKSPSSEADVQIDSIDRHISRQHAIIKITRVADGSLRALISCTKDRLTTIVGGQSLSVGDEAILTNGITLTLGQTSLVYLEE
jgi:DNA-directed RNA polymerase subunit RPC12/RpoP